jgi:hypothetical protein
MDGGSQTFGFCVLGSDYIALHTSLGTGKIMDKVCLEEVTHYVTGSTDGSRDLQDFLFKTITDIAF